MFIKPNLVSQDVRSARQSVHHLVVDNVWRGTCHALCEGTARVGVSYALRIKGLVLHGVRKRYNAAMDKFLGCLPDEELMVLASGGDEKAFTEIHNRHKKRLLSYLIRCCWLWRGAITADDLFQEVWAKLWKARKRYVPKAKFTTYLYTIAHNALVDNITKPLEDSSPDGAEPELEELPIDISIDLDRALDQLPAEQRGTFILFAVVGMTVPEIADVQQENEETVKSRIRYARKKLKTLSPCESTIAHRDVHRTVYTNKVTNAASAPLVSSHAALLKY